MLSLDDSFWSFYRANQSSKRSSKQSSKRFMSRGLRFDEAKTGNGLPGNPRRLESALFDRSSKPGGVKWCVLGLRPSLGAAAPEQLVDMRERSVDWATSFLPPHSATIAGCEQGCCGWQRTSVRERLRLVYLQPAGQIAIGEICSVGASFPGEV